MMNKRQVILFGAGTYLMQVIEGINKTWDIMFICDNDKNKWNTSVQLKNSEKFQIYSPAILEEYKESDVIITSMYEDEIVLQLNDMGIINVYRFSDNPFHIEYKHSQLLKEYIRESFENFGYSEYKSKEEKNKWVDYVYQLWNNHLLPFPILKDIWKCESLEGKKVLDYGCGCGTLILYLLCNEYDAYGVEMDIRKYEYYCQKIDDLGYPTSWKERMILYDGEKIPFDENEFDVVLSAEVIEHVKDCKDSIKEMLRVCKKSGSVYIDAPNYDSSWESHFLVDFNKPLRGNKEEFKNYIEQLGGNSSLVDEINFINYEDVVMHIEELGYGECVTNLNEENPLAKISLVINKAIKMK